MGEFNENFHWWKSKTIWAIVISLLCQGVKYALGYEIGEQEQNELVNLGLSLASDGAAVAAIFFRISATRKIGGDGNGKG